MFFIVQNMVSFGSLQKNLSIPSLNLPSLSIQSKDSQYPTSFSFHLIIIVMKIKSNHFKKQYDLQKAELIGQGNFAQVYKIYDNEQNESIAIRKVKKSQADIEDINKEKLINQQLKKVDNENILKIYDIIDQEETVWYITEYCSGGSLWDALNMCKDNKMGEKQALQCILQVSKGVQELHNHRITHRDLKPENILLKSKYVIGKPLPLIKLADFGLSTQKIIMQTIAGTKQYIAPEQAKFHNYTNAVDVWSLGIIFDQILHGTPFYSGEDNKEVFNKILKMPFKIRDESIRPAIKELLMSLLKKKPYQRPIIAVIRSTIEKILQQIEQENSLKNLEVNAQKNKKSKSSNQPKQIPDFSKQTNDNKISTTNSSSKDNINSVQSTKVYQTNTIEVKEEAKPQKIWKSNNAIQSTPNSKGKYVHIKEELNNIAKNQSIVGKPELRMPETRGLPASNYKQKLQRNGNKNKSIVDEFFPPEKKQEEKTAKIAPRIQSKIQLQVTPKVETAPKIAINAPIQQKISIYKAEKKKIIVSTVKKQELKQDIIDINAFKNKMFNNKKGLLEKQLKAEKIVAFLPNTHLSVNEFQQISGSSQQAVTNFKKKMNFLNYFSESEDYEIRLAKGERDLNTNKEHCIDQLKNLRQNIKRVFLQQIDSYIDQYVQKILK